MLGLPSPPPFNIAWFQLADAPPPHPTVTRRRAEVGGSARKTNRDYTEGKLPELIDIIIEEKAKLFVCAIGVPPKEQIDKLHK